MNNEIDLLGLDEFGQSEWPTGYLWGAGTGAATGFTASLLARMLATPGSAVAKNSEAFGFLTSMLLGGGLMFSEKYRPMGIGTIIGGGIASGLRMLENMMSSKSPAQLGITTYETPDRSLMGLGLTQAEYLNGLGVTQALPEPHAYGTVPGVAGTQEDNGRPPIDLMGNESAGAQQVTLLGGPQTSGLAGSYGATIY